MLVKRVFWGIMFLPALLQQGGQEGFVTWFIYVPEIVYKNVIYAIDILKSTYDNINNNLLNTIMNHFNLL